MPYTIKKNDKGQFCVHKKDAEGMAMGESLGCHGSKKEASAQIGAIESSESKKNMETHEVIIDGVPYKAAHGADGEDESTKAKYRIEGEVEIYPAEQEEEEEEDKDEEKGADTKKSATDETYAAQAFCVKSLGENRIGGWAILFGDETRKDFYNEYFDEHTEDVPTLFKAMGALPFLVEHATDDHVFKTTVVGVVDTLELRDKGWWWEAKIKEHELYRQHVKPLIERQALYTSTGTLPGALRVERKSGYIKRWPVAEVTGTISPAEWRMLLERPVDELRAYYKSAGLDFLEETSNETDEERARGIEKMRLRTQMEQRKLSLRLSKLYQNKSLE